MIYSSLTSLIGNAKSVFLPRSENDVKSFENYIFNKFISDNDNNMELDSVNVEEELRRMSNNGIKGNRKRQSSIRKQTSWHNIKKCYPYYNNSAIEHVKKKDIVKSSNLSGNVKRCSMMALPNHCNDEELSYNLQRFHSMQYLKHSHSVSGAESLVVLRAPPTTLSNNSISPSHRSAFSNSSNTAKHEQLSQAASTAAASIATSLEKEKKRKEVSSSRVKKFHRHFSQVSKDEKLINYFSCALVSDILLQGHLYITDKHFAFYSNVFGYVTKVVIPTSSVTKISKEKTAKIIPNAVGVATADERHVFGSFISREAAYRLMCSVCPNPLAPIELIAKDLTNIEISEEYSIEDDSSCSVSGNESPTQITENSSYTNISDKVPTITKAVHIDASQTLLRCNIGNNNSNLSINGSTSKQRHSDIPSNAKIFASSNDIRSPAPTNTNANFFKSNLTPIRINSSNSNNNNYKSNKIRNSFSQSTCFPSTITSASTLNGSSLQNNVKFVGGTLSKGNAMVSPTPLTTPSSPTTIITKSDNKLQGIFKAFRCCANNLLLRINYPTELHVVYIGVFLTLLLTVFTIFLLFRVLDVEAKSSLYHRSPFQFNWHSDNNDDIFYEALRLQKELQHKSNKEVESILRTNLEQIAKVRRSLETLSMLINQRRSSFDYAQPVKHNDETTK